MGNNASIFGYETIVNHEENILHLYNILSNNKLDYKEIDRYIILLTKERFFSNFLNTKLNPVDYNVFINKITIIQLLIKSGNDFTEDILPRIKKNSYIVKNFLEEIIKK